MPFLALMANTRRASIFQHSSLLSTGNSHTMLQLLRTPKEPIESSLHSSIAYHLNQNASNVIGTKCVTSYKDCCLPLCPILSHDLGLSGPIAVNLTAPTWMELEQLHPELNSGGRWKPKQCKARSRVAIVVPYLKRDKNLRIFLQHIHPFLQKQQLEYGIFLAEPIWDGANRTMQFNRGLMRNIGFKEAIKYGEYESVIFHDLDLLPEIDYNNYGCPDMPRHMCIAVSYDKYTPYKNKFGGIVAFRTDHFVAVNGYSNVFFGWGGEDDDLGRRCKRDSGLGIIRIPASIGRYKGASHKKDHKAKDNSLLWRYGQKRWKEDGLKCLKYTLLKREERATYTWVLADYPERLYSQARKYFLSDIKVLEEERIANNT